MHDRATETCSVPDAEEDGMGMWIRVSRWIVVAIGIGTLLLAVGNLVTGGGSITDPVMSGGLVLGLLAIGAGVWTAESGTLQALVVWLGVVGILATLAIVRINVGDMQMRDVMVYIGIPTLVVLAAAVGVGVGRVRAGALGE
ncbi:MAG: hypothetical protein ACXWWQ_06835 [Candidatus Limnocylindria bacterium]